MKTEMSHLFDLSNEHLRFGFALTLRLVAHVSIVLWSPHAELGAVNFWDEVRDLDVIGLLTCDSINVAVPKKIFPSRGIIDSPKKFVNTALFVDVDGEVLFFLLDLLPFLLVVTFHRFDERVWGERNYVANTFAVVIAAHPALGSPCK